MASQSSSATISTEEAIRYPDLSVSGAERAVQADIAALFLDADLQQSSTSVVKGTEEALVNIPGVIVHLIDHEHSVHLATGNFSLVRLAQSGNGIAVLARVGDELQWPLTKDEVVVRLDDCHYFFTLRVPPEIEEELRLGSPEAVKEPVGGESPSNILNYGLTFTSVDLSTLRKLDDLLAQYSLFTTSAVEKEKDEELVGKEIEPQGEIVEERSADFWTTLAPDVEDYSSKVARSIAAGAGNIIKGLMWCSSATVAQLEGGDKFIRQRLKPKEIPTTISPSAVRRLQRVQKISAMCEEVVTGVLSGVVKAAAFITRPIMQSKAGQKILHLLPGEIALASLDAFGKIFDAVEVAGKSVLTTTSLVTTGIVSQRYGEEASKFTQEGLVTAGHFLTTAWTISKIRKVFNPSGFAKTGVKISANEEGSTRRLFGPLKVLTWTMVWLPYDNFCLATA